MHEEKESSQATQNNAQMKHLRELLLGKNNQLITQALKDNAREIVGEVFSEAMHDRQKNDGSVNNVLLPMVEKSVEKSVATQREKFVGYLYPLVGSLVRKYVTAFTTDLLEKTNRLIENSLTIRGIKWRFRAWRSGVSFSQYVTTQTFSFRVEQVLLIHRETALLLKSVSYGSKATTDTADANMVSSMLSAINDFVTDSFTPNKDGNEQNLSVVKTDDFTLLIKSGPQAILVAAVSGNMPQRVASQMQISIEEIHKLFGDELADFSGDARPLENTEQQLRDCFISELRTENKKKRKRPWLALISVCLLLVSLGYYATVRWETEKIAEHLSQINTQPGIVLNNIEVLGLHEIAVRLMRDPSAVSVEKWLNDENILSSNITVSEDPYLSLEPSLVKARLLKILQDYPQLEITWQNELPIISGELKNIDKLSVQRQVDKVAGLNNAEALLNRVRITELGDGADDAPAIMRAILDLVVVKVDSAAVDFATGVSDLSDPAIEQLLSVANDFKAVIDLAEKQDLAVGLIIMGASDSLGGDSYNQALSQKRANAVKLKLQDFGIDESRLNAIGLGVIELKSVGTGARKVMFNVVYFDAN
jgi:outer membrane protein OmpA-like peptidoglycan-associated protein